MSEAQRMHQVGPGFADPVADAQRTFRSLLTALSEPGRVQVVDAWPSSSRPGPRALDGRALHTSTLATLLTLLDQDTRVDFHGLVDAEEIRDYVRFHCGARASGDRPATFVLVRGLQADPELLERLDWGSDEAPEAASTVIVEVDALSAEKPVDGTDVLTLRGPGIPHSRQLAVGGPPPAFWHARKAMQGHFPRGVDLVLCCHDRIAALPRSTLVDVEA